MDLISLHCRVEPYLIKAAPHGAAGAPDAGLCAWGARPARARRCWRAEDQSSSFGGGPRCKTTLPVAFAAE